MSPNGSGWASVYPLLVGAFLGLGLLKFGNPVILDRFVAPPADIWEIIFQTWPSTWGFGLLFAVAALGAPLVKYRRAQPAWLVWMPLVWLGWQLLAGWKTVNPGLTYATLPQFIGAVVCFYVGYLVVGGLPGNRRIWPFLLAAFVYVLFKGFSQHYGELEETRRYFFLYTDPAKITPEMAGKMNSDRVFSTLLYPNTFAGVILLILPASVAYLISISAHWPRVIRGVALGALVYMAAACMLWSGSKAGLLIALAMGMVMLLRFQIPRAFKIALVGLVFVGGMAGFFLKYRSYIEKGATSVTARMDYWKVGAQTAMEFPILGTGPGTFQVIYQARKPPQAEMARLAHNDYLQQASDSGIPGAVAYLIFIGGSLVVLYRKSHEEGLFSSAIWLGVFGLALQGMSEFWLYIPALAWAAFFFIGWLHGLKANAGVGQTAEIPSTTPVP
jgi:hypothetical protein